MSHVLFAGLATLDIQYFVDTYPGSNTKVKTAPPQFLVGGPATNAAIAYSFLHGKALLVTAIGNNSFRHFFETDFQENRISLVDFVEDRPVNPVIATVITHSENGDRTILSHHPENDFADFDAKNIFRKYSPKLLFVDGFYPSATLALCWEARKLGVPVVFDGGSWKEHLPALLPFVDVAICSNDFHPPGCVDSEAVFDYLFLCGIENVAITRGGNSVLYGDRTQSGQVSVPRVQVVDTLGAGDFFHGSFCFYWLQTAHFEGALQKAAHFASATCEYPGTRNWIGQVSRDSFVL